MQDQNYTSEDLPAPRRAATELPDQASVDEAGIELARDEALHVVSAVSRLVGRGRSKTRMHVHDALMGLAFMGRQALERNGVTEPAPFPDIPLGRWPQGPDVFRRLGFTNRDLERYWAQSRHRADDACLPLEWALAFVPATAWPMVAQVIKWGPERVRLQMIWAASEMARTTTQRDRRRRPAGEPLSLSTIEHRIFGVWQLLEVLCELRSLAITSPVLSLPLLDAWTVVPERVDARMYGARDANQDNSGPGVEACSQRLKQLIAEAQASRRRDGYLKRRRALMMGLLCVFGPRADAFRTARVEDFIPDHAFADGSTGPVLRIFPAKTWQPDQPHYLALPQHQADQMVEWITVTGRHIGQPDEPLFPNRKPKADQANQFLSPHGFYTAIAGARQKGNTGSRPLLAMGDDPYIGWRPHAYRHTAFKLAVQAATSLQRNDANFFPHVHPQEFAKAIVGHHLVNDVGAIYRDLDRQALTRAVAEEMWRILYDDGVQRRGPDPDAVRQVREQCDALRVTTEALGRTITDLEAKAEHATARASNVRDTERSLHLKLQATEHRLNAQAHRDDLGRLQERFELAEQEFARAQTTLVPIPEHVSEAEYARRLAEALGEPEKAISHELAAPVLADELPIKDVADLFGTTPQTICRWRRLGQPKHRPLRWHGGEDAWHDHTQKDRWLRRSAINTQALTPDQERRLEEILIRLALEDGRSNAASADGRLDAWETSGSSPPDDQTGMKEASE